MGKTLLGVEVPPNAVRFCIRPVVTGSGNVQSLFEGSLDENAALSDLAILDAMQSRPETWAKLEALSKQRRLQYKPGDIAFTLRLKVQFYSADGVASDGVVTPEEVELLRVGVASPEPSARKPGGAAAVGESVAAIAPALERLVTAAVREATAQVKASLELSGRLADKLEKQLERESARVDGAIEQNAFFANSSRQTGGTTTTSGLGVFGDLLRVAGEAKKFLN